MRETHALPPGARAQTARTLLSANGRPLLGFTQGKYRSYLHPVLTPRGFCATAEHPADHPHHAGIWIAADRVSWWPDKGPDEEHTYNFYVDDVFQGRAPGRIVSTGLRLAQKSRDAVQVEQTCLWRGPSEWGARRGRAIAVERRIITVRPAERWNVVDIESMLAPRLGRLRIGPTRHAWFNVRLADAAQSPEARLAQSAHEPGRPPAWMDLSGPIGGGHRVGVALLQLSNADAADWFAATWGIVTVQPFARKAREIPLGETLQLTARFVVHDGDIGRPELDALAAPIPLHP